MTAPWRLVLLAAALIVLVPSVWHVAAALPPFGHPSAQYGPAINAILPAARHVTNMVAAVNFDVRGFDTLGEECMLVCAVTGAVVLLRGARGERDEARAGHVPGRAVLARSDATVLVCRITATLTLLFGVYMALHGTVTPGGGFQGGVVAASSFMLLYLGEGYRAWRRIIRGRAMDALEGGGAFLFAVAAAVPLVIGRPALTNVLPFGQLKDLFSGGLMVVVNFCIFLSVTGSFGLLLLEFMEETRSPAEDSVPDEADR
ncbi:MAG TPA: MnhB domain-containing protein [Xanthobacteraceae bacterium]|nr:MnhB domain-containing protein [Xanthobacteraceae bacterium]